MRLTSDISTRCGFSLKRRLALLLTALVLCSCAATQATKPAQAPALSTHPYLADYYFMLGYNAYLSHQWKDAVGYYRKALQQDPESLYLRTEISFILSRTGDVDGGLAMAEDVLRQAPRNISALMIKGEIYLGQKKTEEAISIYRKILSIDPGNRQAALALGRIYYVGNRLDEAAGVLQALVDKHPDELMALDYLGSIYIDKKDFDKAEGYLRKIIDFNPDVDTVYFKLGIISELKGRLADAAADYEAALRINPHNSQARERLGQVYIQQKSLGKAIDEFRTLSEEAPEDADMHMRIGVLYFEEKQYDSALDEFRSALRIKPDNSAIHYYVALVLEETGRYEDAAAELKQVIDREPKNINAFLHLAYIYSKLNRPDDAIKMYEEILEFAKEKPEIYLYLAGEYMDKKEYDKAEAVMKDAVSRFSSNDDLQFNLGILMDKMGRFDEMVEHMRKAIELNPGNADALNYLGYSFADKGIHLDEARSLIERALKERPDNGFVLDSLAWVYYRQGEYEKALQAIRKALDITRDDPVVLEHAGDICNALKKPKEAIGYWEKALAHQEKEEGLKERVEKKIRDLKLQLNK